MKIEIVTPGSKSEYIIRQFIQRKLQFALDRIEQRIEKVVVRLEDAGRSSRAFDGVCQIDAWLNPSGQLHVQANGSTPEETVVNAVTKLEHAVSNNIERHRRAARVRHEKSKREFIASLAIDPIVDGE